MHACTYCISLSNILMGLVNSQANPNSSGLLSLLLLAAKRAELFTQLAEAGFDELAGL